MCTCIRCTKIFAGNCAVNCKEALALYEAGPEVVVKHLCEVHAQLEAAQKRVKALEEQLRKNSRNSSKPPSSDGFKKPTPPSSEQHEKKRKGKKRKPGGQKGHKGSGLTPVEKPDHTTVHEAHECKKCGRSLKKQTPVGDG